MFNNILDTLHFRLFGNFAQLYHFHIKIYFQVCKSSSLDYILLNLVKKRHTLTEVEVLTRLPSGRRKGQVLRTNIASPGQEKLHQFLRHLTTSKF